MSEQVTAAMLVIGNEILSGRTRDANIQTLAQRLSEIGVVLSEARVVPDIQERVVSALNELRTVYDYVFTSGGIGPTHDDITVDCVAKAFGLNVEVNSRAFEVLENHYGAKDFTEARQRMARIPAGAGLIDNPVSAAPGFVIENVYVMAGVPRIFDAMLANIVPVLRGGCVVLSETLTFMIPESQMAGPLGEVQGAHPKVDIGSYPFFQDGRVGVSVVLRCTDKSLLEAACDNVRDLAEDHA